METDEYDTICMRMKLDTYKEGIAVLREKGSCVMKEGNGSVAITYDGKAQMRMDVKSSCGQSTLTYEGTPEDFKL